MISSFIFILTCAICIVSGLDSRADNDINTTGNGSNVTRTFSIDYERNTFLKDGEPFRYISGSMHYFRMPKQHWRDRLRKLRQAGLNAVCTYVEWSSHEPAPGQFHFTGDTDLELFVSLAAEEGLLVILRPGPYICAERDFGGFPPWLLSVNPDIQLRTNDETYQKYVKLWFDQLFARLHKHLYGNGGNIILVQVENEYGSFSACTKDHMGWMRDLVKGYVGDAAVLFSTDGADPGYLKCTVDGVYVTVDFGAEKKEDIEKSFAAQRTKSKRGPLVNSEFYPGWLTHWDEHAARVWYKPVADTLYHMLSMGANVNFYMFYGGTNFGFSAGANGDDSDNSYHPDITSYDYNAPITEAGDPTQKYVVIRNVVREFNPQPKFLLPSPAPKADYGDIVLQPVASIFDKETQFYPSEQQDSPMTFEQLRQSYGFVLYETNSIQDDYENGVLEIEKCHDRGYVFVDEQLQHHVLDRHDQITKINLSIKKGQKLSIFVENMGRINYGTSIKDFKGIVSDVTLNGDVIKSWKMTRFPLSDISTIETLPPSNNKKLPVFYTGTFTLQKDQEVLDSFVDMSHWRKGVVFVNNFNLGSYWSSASPQLTLYLPSSVIKPYPEVNTITVFELEHPAKDLLLQFSTVPIWGEPKPKLKRISKPNNK